MKRFTALVLALVMTAGMLPAAHAAGSYDDVQEYENGLARVWKDGKCGAIDASGREVAPPIYDSVWLYEENYIHVGKKTSEGETLCGLLDREGNVLLPVEYEGIGELRDGRRQVGLNGKEGYMDENLQWVIPAIYDRAWPFEAGLAWVEIVKEDWGYIGGVLDREGREVLPCVYNDVHIFEDGMISAGQYTGETGRFGGRVEKHGLFDRAGNMLLPMEYDWITCYNVAWGDEDHRVYDDYFELQKETPEGGSLKGIADRKGNIVLPVEYWDLRRPDAERWIVDKDGKWGVLDKDFQVVIPLQYEYMWDYEDSYLVTGHDKWGVIDLAGKPTIPMEYDMIEYWEGKGLCSVSKDGKHGVLTYPQGQAVVPLIYDELLEQYASDLAIVMKDGQYGVIDYTTGAVVVPMAFDGIATDVYGMKGNIMVIKGGLYGAYDQQGKQVYACQFPTEERLRGAIAAGTADPSVVEGGSQAAGLEVTWYPGVSYIIRRYGTDRMLLVKDGKSGLFGLDGKQYTGFIFDAVGEFDESGQAAAARNGKWGKIDLDGNTVLDFTCDSQQEAELGIKFVGRWGKNDPPFALFTSAGKQLTGYDFWAVGDFFNGFARVTDGNAYAYLDTSGKRITDFVFSEGSANFGEDGYARVHSYATLEGYNVIDREGKLCLPWSTRYGRLPWRAGFGIWGYLGDGGIGFVEAHSGRVVSEPRFENAFSTKGGVAGYKFNANGLMSVVLREGEELKYYLMDTQGNLTAVEVDGETGLPIDPATGETYLPTSGPEPWLDENGKQRQVYFEGLRKIDSRDKLKPPGEKGYGFASEAGEVVVPLLYDDVGDFDHGYASVRLNGVYGLLKNPLTASDQPQTPAEGGALAGLDIAWMDTENPVRLLGRDNLVTEQTARRTWAGRHGPESDWDHGLFNADGERLLPTQYGYTLPGGPRGYGATAIFAVAETGDDLQPVYTDYLGRQFQERETRPAWDPDVPEAYREPSMDGNDKWGYADPWTGEIVIPATYDITYSFTEGVGVVGMGEWGGEWQYYAIDEQGNKLFDFDTFTSWSNRYADGLMCVEDKATRKWGFIDPSGKVVIPLEWDMAWDFSEGLALVSRDGKYGYIDQKGQTVIPPVFEEYGDFENGLCIVSYNGQKGILKNPLLKHKTSDWAAAEVAAATQAGYVTGSCEEYQTFTITRRQFASLAVNYLEKKTGRAIAPAPADTFTDADDEAVLKAYAAGIVQGTGEGKFSPGGLLTREQLATMLWRAMSKAGVKAVSPSGYMSPADLSAYADAGQVSDWARDSVTALAGLGVMEGTGDGRLSPKDSCTVEQAILLVYRAAEGERMKQAAQYQAALERVTVEGIAIGAPFDELPQELRSTLKQEGEAYDSGAFTPGEEVGRRYKAPGIELITSEATEKVLKRALEGQDKDYLLKHYGSEDWEAVYRQMLGREYVDTVILTGEDYQMASGLKVGDSRERVEELGYALSGETYSGSAGFSGSADIFMDNGKVARIEAYDCIGRRIGAFFDP